MYLQHFRLRELPFTLTPDTAFFMERAGYLDGLNVLLVALRSGEGFVKVVGEVGTGKTLLCRRLINALGEEFRCAYLPNPYLSPASLLLSVVEELGIGLPTPCTQHQLLRRLNAALLQFAVNPASRVPMVGASGAIFGVMGAYALKFPHARISMIGWFIFLFTFEAPAWVVMLYYLGVNLFSGFGAIADVMNERGGVAFFAHVGGFLAGALLIRLLPVRPRGRLRYESAW